METQKSLFAKFLYRFKNNPVIALVLILGTIVITISSFTDAVKNILPLLNLEAETDIRGTWCSPLLSNQFNKNEQFYLHFEFNKAGNKINGNLNKKWAGSTFQVNYPMQDLVFSGESISFKTTIHTSDGGQFNDFYTGQVQDKTIRFLVKSDRPSGFEPQQFQVTLE